MPYKRFLGLNLIEGEKWSFENSTHFAAFKISAVLSGIEPSSVGSSKYQTPMTKLESYAYLYDHQLKVLQFVHKSDIPKRFEMVMYKK